jgi:hypothetical protein
MLRHHQADSLFLAGSLNCLNVTTETGTTAEVIIQAYLRKLVLFSENN